jgi:hypothetical protein
MYSGYAVLATCWGRVALTAERMLANDPDADGVFLEGKLATARFFFERLLPRTAAHKAAMESGADNLMNLDAQALSAC